MMTVIVFGAFLWTVVASSVCTPGGKYTSWMKNLYEISKNQTGITNATAFEYRSLNQILIPGTHDSGMWSIVVKSGFAVLLPSELFLTQTVDFTQQLCSGCRWFDVRFSKYAGVWRLVHVPGAGVPLAAYSADITTVMNQVKNYLSEDMNQQEIIFWRIKVEGGPADEVANLLRGTLAPYMVDNPTGNASLPEMTLRSIWSQPTRGHLVVMSYDWTPPPVEPGQQQGWIWNYRIDQAGDYSNARTMAGMLTKCSVGQFAKLIRFKQTLNQTNHRLIGTWWTFTTGDIKSNTAAQWAAYPNALNDFYTINKGEIGNIIMSDFFGDYPVFMQIVWDYNFNKFASFPPNDPAKGYSLANNPPLPGIDILTNPNACDNSGLDNAQENFVALAAGLSIIIFLLILAVVCGIPCAVYWQMKKSRKYQPINAS